MLTRTLVLVVAFSLMAGCGDDDGGGEPDAGGGMDSGTPPDTGPRDAGSAEDAGGSGDDAGPDAGGGTDGGGGDTDAGPPGVACDRAGTMTCGAGEYCDYAMGSCGVDETGMCRPRPATCMGGATPVCGCNGMTFANECEANMAGTDVAYPGMCRARMFDDCRVTPCRDAEDRCQRCFCPEPGGCYVCLLPTEMC